MESECGVCKGQWSAGSKPPLDHYKHMVCSQHLKHMSATLVVKAVHCPHLRWASTTTFFGSGGRFCAGGFASATSTVAAAVGGAMAPPPTRAGAECAAAGSVLRQSAGHPSAAISA
jgi:hypothetical protein